MTELKTITNEIPSGFTIEAFGYTWKAKLIYTDDEWYIVKIFYTLYGKEFIANGRGRTFRVAEKFAKQALKKGLT
jgi:hypothetical protein